MKKFEILPSPDGEGVRRTEGVISEEQMSGGQEGFSEVRKLGGQEGRLVNKTSPRPIVERIEFKKLNFPSPAAFFSRRGSGCMRSMSITTTGEVRERGKKAAFTLAEVKGMFPLQGRGLGRGGDKKPSESTNSPSLKFVSSLVLDLLHARIVSFTSHSALSTRYSRYPDFTSFHPSANPPFANKFFSLHRRDSCAKHTKKALSPNSPIAISPSNKKAAFTLAEVLITLGVIGVIAAITLPPLVTNLNERINSERQANIAQKITQAMEQMRAHGQLNTPYASTDAFVDQLQNYLKIAKRCDSSHIADCWPTAKVTTADGEEYEVKNAKKGRDIKHKDNKTNNVGLVLADGASLIMTYNPNAGTIDVGDKVSADKTELPVGGGKFKEFPYTTSVTGSIDFVMDVNGAKGPNSEKIGDKYHDIRSFNGAQFDTGMICDFEVDDLCVKQLAGSYTWDEAKQACSDIDMTLASKANLNTIYAAKGKVSGVPTYGWFWSSEEHRYSDAWFLYFDSGHVGDRDKTYRYGALCVGSN